jgi:hypothetical protein
VGFFWVWAPEEGRKVKEVDKIVGTY